MAKNGVFIGSTGQFLGKTTLCLGIIAGLQRRFSKVGYTKPIGQQHVRIDDHTKPNKDAVLFKNHFHLEADWADISPVIIPSGFTRDYLDDKISEQALLEKILTSFNKISANNDFTVVEGTGHVGVGSIIGLNNARVAAALGLEMVIIASGGLGSSFDELSLNCAMCERFGVKIRGVILNRVRPDKKDMVLEYFPRALKKWGIPLIGCVPFSAFLNNLTVRDYEALFKVPLLSGAKHHFRHFKHYRLVAGSLETYLKEIEPNELIITPATREDIIMATINRHKEVLDQKGADHLQGGIILTGRHAPGKRILSEISNVDIPSLYAPICSYEAMKMITGYTAKIRSEDHEKIERATSLVEENIDLNLLCPQPQSLDKTQAL